MCTCDSWMGHSTPSINCNPKQMCPRVSMRVAACTRFLLVSPVLILKWFRSSLPQITETAYDPRFIYCNSAPVTVIKFARSISRFLFYSFSLSLSLFRAVMAHIFFFSGCSVHIESISGRTEMIAMTKWIDDRLNTFNVLVAGRTKRSAAADERHAKLLNKLMWNILKRSNGCRATNVPIQLNEIGGHAPASSAGNSSYSVWAMVKEPNDNYVGRYSFHGGINQSNNRRMGRGRVEIREWIEKWQPICRMLHAAWKKWIKSNPRAICWFVFLNSKLHELLLCSHCIASSLPIRIDT